LTSAAVGVIAGRRRRRHDLEQPLQRARLAEPLAMHAVYPRLA
jgi:hypothetical protein